MHLLSLILSLVSLANAVDPLVNLGYAQYRGYNLANNQVTQWLGIRYAAPPTGNLRFAPPQPPAAMTEIQDGTQEGALCVAANMPEGFQYGQRRQPMAEDCLFLAVYAPANATTTSRLPIMFFIQGGGFTSNSNGNFNGTSLVQASGGNMVVVRINYRVGILGFLTGSEVERNPTTSSNNGLNDMIAALRWVQQYATLFGGDPSHVVLSGDSAGGNAIDLLISANGGTGFPDLFVGAAAESTSWGAESQVVDLDANFAANVRATGCESASNVIDCMRTIPIDIFQNQTMGGWGPVIDGTLITAPHYQLYEQGRFQKIPVIHGSASNEGTPDYISNQTTNTEAELAQHLRSNVPSATDAQVQEALALYPDTLNQRSFFGRDVAPVTANVSAREGNGTQWQREAALMGEIDLICVGLFMSDSHASAPESQGKVWQYRYNVLDTTPGGLAEQGLFSQHTLELYSIWGSNNTDSNDPKCYTVPAAQGGCQESIGIMQSYWISFVRTLNPNTLRAANLPEWAAYSPCTQNRIVFNNDNATMEVVGREAATAGQTQTQRCRGLTGTLTKSKVAALKAGQTLAPFANGTRMDPVLACGSGGSNGTGVPVTVSAAGKKNGWAVGVAGGLVAGILALLQV